MCEIPRNCLHAEEKGGGHPFIEWMPVRTEPRQIRIDQAAHTVSLFPRGRVAVVPDAFLNEPDVFREISSCAFLMKKSSSAS